MPLLIIILFSVKIVVNILLISMSFLFQHMTCSSWFLFVSFRTHLILRIYFVFRIILISLNYYSMLFCYVSIFINRIYCFSVRVLQVFPCRFLSLNTYLIVIWNIAFVNFWVPKKQINVAPVYMHIYDSTKPYILIIAWRSSYKTGQSHEETINITWFQRTICKTACFDSC